MSKGKGFNALFEKLPKGESTNLFKLHGALNLLEGFFELEVNAELIDELYPHWEENDKYNLESILSFHSLNGKNPILRMLQIASACERARIISHLLSKHEFVTLTDTRRLLESL